MLLIPIYIWAGYWACGKTIYANSIRVGTWFGLFFKRLLIGTLLGWALIPLALIRMVFKL